MENFSVVKKWIEIYNTKKFGELKPLFAEKATHTWMPDGITHEGAEGIEKGMRLVLTGVPDLVTTINNSVVQGDKIAVEVHWTGTHTGDYMGVKPTGKRIDLYGLYLIQMENGKIKSTREFYYGWPS